MNRPFRVGDRVVYKKQKHSTSPGRRAKEIHPATSGDQYSYSVDKYWLVVDVSEDKGIEVVTRRGKRHWLQADDQRLRLSAWWEKLVFGKRFPNLASGSTGSEFQAIEGSEN